MKRINFEKEISKEGNSYAEEISKQVLSKISTHIFNVIFLVVG